MFFEFQAYNENNRIPSHRFPLLTDRENGVVDQEPESIVKKTSFAFNLMTHHDLSHLSGPCEGILSATVAYLCDTVHYSSCLPTGSPSRGGDITVYVWHKQTELAHSFLFCSYVCFFLWPFQLYFIPEKLPTTLRFLTLFFRSYLSALLVFSTTYLFMKVSFSPDIIHSGWLGSKHQLPTYLHPLGESWPVTQL